MAGAAALLALLGRSALAIVREEHRNRGLETREAGREAAMEDESGGKRERRLNRIYKPDKESAQSVAINMERRSLHVSTLPTFHCGTRDDARYAPFAFAGLGIAGSIPP